MDPFVADAESIGRKVAEYVNIAQDHAYVCYATFDPLFTLNLYTSPALRDLATDDVFTTGLQQAACRRLVNTGVAYRHIKLGAMKNQPARAATAASGRLSTIRKMIAALAASHAAAAFVCYIRSPAGADLLAAAIGPWRDVFQQPHWGRVADLLASRR